MSILRSMALRGLTLIQNVTAISIGSFMFNQFVCSAVLCSGPSMQPTLKTNDVLLTEQISARMGWIDLGDIVVSRVPGESGTKCVCKRVVAQSGDLVRYRGKTIKISRLKMSLGNINGIFSINNALLRAVLKENRLTLVDSLGECLAVADWIFEQGFLYRQDYNEIECISSKMERAKKLIDILETKENGAFHALLLYFEKEKEKAEADSEKAKQTALSALIQKLKNSHTKFSSQFPEENLAQRKLKTISKPTLFSNSNGKSTKENIKDSKTVIDSNDFPVTEREAKVIKQIIGQFDEELVMSQWLEVLQNMIALDTQDIDLIQGMLKSDSKWEDVITQTLKVWMRKNGKNATFFSLVGVFQEARFYNISGSADIQPTFPIFQLYRLNFP